MKAVALREQLAAHLHQMQEAKLASFDAYAHADFETARRMNEQAERHQRKAAELHHEMRAHAIVWGRKGSVFPHPPAPARKGNRIEFIEPEEAFVGDFH